MRWKDDHLAQKRGVNRILQHSVHTVGKLVQILLVGTVLLKVPSLASLHGQAPIKQQLTQCTSWL